MSDWDIDLSRIRVPLDIWQGTCDTFGARPGMARYVADAVRGSTLHLSSHGHLSVLTEQLPAILRTVAGTRGSERDASEMVAA